LRTVPSASVQVAAVISAPDDHLAAGLNCRVKFSGIGCAGRASGCPTVRAEIVSPASIEIGAELFSAPENHFRASPNCRVVGTGGGRISGGSGDHGIIGVACLPWVGVIAGRKVCSVFAGPLHD